MNLERVGRSVKSTGRIVDVARMKKEETLFLDDLLRKKFG